MTTKNYSLRLVTGFAVACSLLLFGAATAFAATDNASSNESFVQGLQKNGAAVNVLRSNPADALGASDGAFVSLGYGGELTVGFAQNMSGNLLLAVQEVTGGPYPLETADVYVSTSAAGPWTLVGEATNEEGLGDGITSLAVNTCYQYVRIIDTTDGDLHDATSDGFDIDSFTAEYDGSCPEPEVVTKPTSVYVSLHSGAMIMNEVHTAANTGGNLADGSYAGSGGDGGDIENGGGEQDVEESTTGNGGSGGDAGLGGAVQTGDALAESGVANTVNSNIVRIDSCGCNGSLTLGRVRVRTNDFAFLGNRVETAANTGGNDALGSYAGEGGEGGDIENGDDNGRENHRDGNGGGDDDDGSEQEIDDSTTGTGGDGGASDAGGSVLTGNATTRAAIVNLVNSNRIRIR